MEILRSSHPEGARSARGHVIVIDVLRAFTTAAVALAAGATDILLVDSIPEAFALKKRFPGAFVMGEDGGFKVEGFDHGNSPSDFPSHLVAGRRIIQRTGSGTRTAAAVGPGTDALFVSSLVIATATARAVQKAPVVTIVASAGDREGDDAVGDYLEGYLRGKLPDPDAIVRRIRDSEAGRKIASGEFPQYPAADLETCTRLDAFTFAIRVETSGDLRVARRI